jgi:hypothetical protein
MILQVLLCGFGRDDISPNSLLAIGGMGPVVCCLCQHLLLHKGVLAFVRQLLGLYCTGLPCMAISKRPGEPEDLTTTRGWWLRPMLEVVESGE